MIFCERIAIHDTNTNLDSNPSWEFGFASHYGNEDGTEKCSRYDLHI